MPRCSGKAPEMPHHGPLPCLHRLWDGSTPGNESDQLYQHLFYPPEQTEETQPCLFVSYLCVCWMKSVSRRLWSRPSVLSISVAFSQPLASARRGFWVNTPVLTALGRWEGCESTEMCTWRGFTPSLTSSFLHSFIHLAFLSNFSVVPDTMLSPGHFFLFLNTTPSPRRSLLGTCVSEWTVFGHSVRLWASQLQLLHSPPWRILSGQREMEPLIACPKGVWQGPLTAGQDLPHCFQTVCLPMRATKTTA